MGTNLENNYQDAVTAKDVQDAPAKGKGTVKPSLLNETLSKGEQTTADTLAVLSGEPGRIGAFLDQAGANPAHGKDERVPVKSSTRRGIFLSAGQVPWHVLGAAG